MKRLAIFAIAFEVTDGPMETRYFAASGQTEAIKLFRKAEHHKGLHPLEVQQLMEAFAEGEPREIEGDS